MGKHKPLAPKGLPPKPGIDLLMVVGSSSSVTASDFQKAKQLCLAMCARVDTKSQIGIVQYGTQATIVSTLTSHMEEVDAKLAAMVQLGGSSNLIAALDCCLKEFGLSRLPFNEKQIWIITTGLFEDSTNTALAAQKLRHEKHAVIFGIGIGAHATVDGLNIVTSPGCSFLISNFEDALKVSRGRGHTKELCVQLSAEIELPLDTPLRLGEDTTLVIEIQNVGHKAISTLSRIKISENTYFKENIVIIPRAIEVGEAVKVATKLVTKCKDKPKNTQILALPEYLDFYICSPDNNTIECDCCGFFLRTEYFCGDVFGFKPRYSVPHANIITFGPPGAGKSSFVNSVCSTLGDHIASWAVAGATREVVTASLLLFPLSVISEFKKLNCAFYDIPGIDGKNYKGDEISLLMHGLMPPNVKFIHQSYTYNAIHNLRSSPKEEFNRRVHVVAFFVPQGMSSDTDMMRRLAEHYHEITVTHKRKVVVLISHADELPGEEDKQQVLEDVCRGLGVNSSSVYFLENYVDTKEKQFHVDKSVLQILCALLNATDDFLVSDRLNPVACPFPKNPHGEYLLEPEPQSPDVTNTAEGSHIRDIESFATQLRHLETHVVSFLAEQTSSKTAQYSLQKGNQLETSGDLKLAKYYYKVAVNEAKQNSETTQLAQQACVNIAKRKEEAARSEVQAMITQIKSEAPRNNSSKVNIEAAQRQQEYSFLEQNKTHMESVAKRVAGFNGKLEGWKKTVEELGDTKDSTQLLLEVSNAQKEVEKEYQNFLKCTTRAEYAMVNMLKREEQLQENVDRFQNYIQVIAEQKSSPASEDFRELLKGTKDLARSLSPNKNKIKCFISYAWYPNHAQNAALQARLIKIKADLEKTGIEVMLDIHNMEGDINSYMIDGIQSSDRVLVICTPRFKQRAEETAQTPNNLQKELAAALQKQRGDPKFIIPLILEGDRATSVAKSIQDILSLDFTDRKKYCENMISLTPKGLLPMILGLERNRIYAQLLKGYEAHIKLSLK